MCKPHKDERQPKTTRFKGLRAPRKVTSIDQTE
jgi:hypothetical protein